MSAPSLLERDITTVTFLSTDAGRAPAPFPRGEPGILGPTGRRLHPHLSLEVVSDGPPFLIKGEGIVLGGANLDQFRHLRAPQFVRRHQSRCPSTAESIHALATSRAWRSASSRVRNFAALVEYRGACRD